MTQRSRTTFAALIAILAVNGGACVTSPPAKHPEKSAEIADNAGHLPPEQAEQLVLDLAEDAPDGAAFVDLINTVGSLTDIPLYTDSKVDLLIDGPDTYAAMHRAIKSARQYVHLETYIFSNDKVGREFSAALIDKAGRGVNVRVIVDSIGSFSSGDGFFDLMREAGIEVLEFNDLNPLDGGNPLNANTRDHRKILIVDGTTAFTGGVNFTRTYSSRPGQKISPDSFEDGWRDTHVAVYGPAVAGLEQVFAENWRSLGGSPHARDFGMSNYEQAGDDTIAVLSAEGGDEIQSPIYHAYLEAIRLALKNVWITQAYFAPDDVMLAELQNAARRGVDVRVIAPGRSDSRIVMSISRSLYGDLLKSGVKLYETRSSMLHAKTAVVDGIWATVGSSNLDYRSALHNDEANIVVFGSDFAAKMEAQFMRDLQDCRPIVLDEWERRPWNSKLFELLIRPLAYWM